MNATMLDEENEVQNTLCGGTLSSQFYSLAPVGSVQLVGRIAAAAPNILNEKMETEIQPFIHYKCRLLKTFPISQLCQQNSIDSHNCVQYRLQAFQNTSQY